MVGISSAPIKFILLTPDSMVKIPRAVPVMKTKIPRGFENIMVIINKINNITIDSFW